MSKGTACGQDGLEDGYKDEKKSLLETLQWVSEYHDDTQAKLRKIGKEYDWGKMGPKEKERIKGELYSFYTESNRLTQTFREKASEVEDVADEDVIEKLKEIRAKQDITKQMMESLAKRAGIVLEGFQEMMYG